MVLSRPGEIVRVRVLIVRIGAMGDVLHAMPAVAALRELHPDWRIGWAIEPAWSELLQAESEIHDVAWRLSGRDARRPLVDRWTPVPSREWKRRPLSLNTLRDITGSAAGVARRPLRHLRRYAGVDPVGGGGEDGGMRRCLWGLQSRERLLRRGSTRQKVKLNAVHVVEQGCELLGAAVGETLAAREGDAAGGSRSGAMVR